MEAGRLAAGASRTSRLGPFSFPLRFSNAYPGPHQTLPTVDLHREHVVLHRRVRGMRMALNLPLAAFRGVAIRLAHKANENPTAIAVVLEHGDPALSLPLYASSESDDIV